MHSTTQPGAEDTVRWHIAAGWDDALLGPDGLRLQQWLSEGRAQVVKDGAHRTVYRIDLPDRAFYVKHYRCRRWLSPLKHLLRASASRREWRKTVELARRDLPTAVPIAWGEQKRGGMVLDNYFVSEAIAGTRSIDEFAAEVLPSLPRPQQSRVRRELLVAVARLTASLHRAGVFHNDFHTGNVLLRFDASNPACGQPPQLYLIDLPSVEVSRPLNWKQSRRGLMMLGSGWLYRLSRAERWRFMLAYLAARGDLKIDKKAAAGELFVATRQFANAILRGRDKRALRTNRDYYCLQQEGRVGHAVQSLPPEQLAALMQAPQRLIEQFRDRPVKLSHSSLIVEAELFNGRQIVPIAYKRSRNKTWWKNLTSWLRPSRAISGWSRGHALLGRGIATAPPLAAFQRRIGLRQEGYLAVEWIAGAQNLHLYGWELARRDEQQQFRRARQCAESLGRLLGRMHGWEISHRDLKACNLVVTEADDRVDAWLIDLDGVRISRRLCLADRSRDLARLSVSMEAHTWLTRSLKLRFLRKYLREYAGQRQDWKHLWRGIARQHRQIAARLNQLQQPLV